MTTVSAYLERLRERYGLPPFPPSPLRPEDFPVLEAELGFPIPEQYRDFLLAAQLPDLALRMSLAGNGVFFWGSISPETGEYMDFEEDGPSLIDLNLFGLEGTCGEDYAQCFRKRAGEMTAWLEAGFLHLANFYMEDYFVFYDLQSGKVLYIHNEDINESSIVCDHWDDPPEIRKFMESEARVLCRDFQDFLRLVSTGEVYDDEAQEFLPPEN